jgi:hypothetical protein
MAVPPPPPHPPRRRHIGILVIHGIGAERAYGALDAFTRGLYRHFHDAQAKPVYAMDAEWKERGADPAHKQSSWTQAQIHFEKDAAADPQFAAAPDRMTVAEYYWSPATKGKIKDLAVLTWLFRSGLEPFRYISENLQAIIRAAGGQISDKEKNRARWRIALREFGRLAWLYPLLLGSFMAVAAFLGYAAELASHLRTIFASPTNMVLGLLIALRLFILLSLARYFWNYRKWKQFRLSPKGPGLRFGTELLGFALLLAAVLFAGPVWLAHAWHGPHVPAPAFAATSGHGIPAWPGWIRFAWRWVLAWLGQYLFLIQPFSEPTFTVPVAELALAAVIRWFLIDFLGDVAIYTNLNQRAGDFAVRAQILEECGHAVTSMYSDLRAEAGPNDDFGIVIAAHSLGSVIAYDTINDLFNRSRIGANGAGTDLAGQTVPAAHISGHLRGLLTFGSPLNKTYYFFRDQSAAEQLVRAQIIDQLHSFRQAAPCLSLPGDPVEPVPIPAALQAWVDSFLWVNLWSRADLFSGHLFFYTPDWQYQRPYRIPMYAHLSYWDDPVMYRLFAERLL